VLVYLKTAFTAFYDTHAILVNGKMVNGFRYYRELEIVSIESALSTALTIYPRQIRVHQR